MSIRKSKARKLAEFLRNITAEAKLTTEAVQDDKVVTTGADLDSKSTDATALVSAASVTSYVGDKLDAYVHGTHDINLTFTGDVTGHGTITDMSHTSFNLTLDAETLPIQSGYEGKFLTTDGTTASWATVDTSNGDTAYSWGDHSQAGYLTSETNDYVDSVSFSTSTGILRLGRTGSLSDLTVDLDGRYLQSFTETDTLQSVTARGASTDQNILIEKNNPVLTLSDTNANPSTYPTINFTTTNNQGVNLYYTEFDSELPLGGYGLVLDADSANAQFPDNVGAISLNVLGEVYAGSRELGTLHKVWHAGNLDPNNYLLTSNYEDTTYNVSAVDVSGGKAVRLTGSDGTTDDVKFAAGSNVSLARSGDTITISSTDTNTETTTNLVDNGDNTITYTNEEGTAQTIDLSLYLDDTNLARILSGTMNSSGVATFTRDDNTTFTVDMSVLLDDTNLSRITSASWNTSNGVLTLTRNDNTTVAVDLDGRYVQKNADIVVANAGPRVTLTDTTDSDDHRIAFSNSSTELHSINTIGSRLNIDSVQDIKVNRNGTKILDIVSSGLNVTGAVNATSFSGSLDYNDITNPPVIDNSVDYINGASFNTSNGVLTLSGIGRAGATVDLDNRYLTSYSETDTLQSVTNRGNSTTTGVRIISGSQTSSNTDKGLFFDGNYTNGTYRHRFRKQDLGGGLPLFLDQSTGTANSYSPILRFGSYSGRTEQLEVFGHTRLQGNIRFDGTATTTSQSRGIEWTGFDKEGTTDLSDSAYIKHVTNVGGLSGSVLEIKSLNDAGDGVLFSTNSNTGVRINGNIVFNDAYHPNADKWTTARSHTVTLTGQVTGSATQSVDGTGNKTWSIATTLNDSALDDQYVTVGSRYTGNGSNLLQNSKASVRIWDVSTATDDPTGAQDGLLYTAGWDSSSWGVQQYHDFHSNNYFIRNKYAGTWQGWDKVWTEGNDGPGSGLDADTLDGFDHTQFNPVAVRYHTPTNPGTGRIKIRLPFATNSARMLKFTISVYTGYHQHTYEVSGYLYSAINNWYSPVAIYSGSGTADIKVGRDTDGRAYVSVGSSSYTGAIVHSVTIGHTGTDTDAYNPNWTITDNADTPNTVSISVRNVLNTNNYSATLDSTYVRKSGDTMTGDLVLSSSSIRLPNSSSDGIRSNDNHRVIDCLGDTLRIGDTAKHNIIRMHGNGSDDFRVYYGSTDYKIWHAGNFNPSNYSTTSVADGRYVRKTGDTMTGSLTVPGVLKVTETGTAQHFLIGNQDSGGVNKPAMIRGVNGQLHLGHGSSWSGEGGTMTVGLTVEGNEVGVGTSSPAAKLHLYSGGLGSNTGVTDMLRIEVNRSDHSTTPSGPAILFKDQDTNNTTNQARIKMMTVNDTDFGDNDEAASNFIFETTNGGVAADKMIITGRGDIGMGTNNPKAPLHVTGNVKVGNTNGAASTTIVSDLDRFLEISVQDGSGSGQAANYTSGSGIVFHHGGTCTSAIKHLQPDASTSIFRFDSDRANTRLEIEDGNTRLLKGSGNSLKVQTNSGYIEIGPMNTGHCHLQTDRTNFYFNKEVVVDTGIIGSYNEDLYLRRGRSSAYQIRIAAGTTTISQNTVIQGNLTVSGSISQSDGFGTLYTFNTTQALSTSWADVSAISGSTLPTGTYAIQIKVDNHDTGGGNYSEYYSGTMAWYGSSTNDGDSNEIPLHNAGHAYNGAAIYARTLRRYSSTMILQLAASGSISSDAIEIKIRRLI